MGKELSCKMSGIDPLINISIEIILVPEYQNVDNDGICHRGPTLLARLTRIKDDGELEGLQVQGAELCSYQRAVDLRKNGKRLEATGSMATLMHLLYETLRDDKYEQLINEKRDMENDSDAVAKHNTDILVEIIHKTKGS